MANSNGDLTLEEKKSLNIKQKKIMNKLISNEATDEMNKEYYKEAKAIINNNKKNGNNKKDGNNPTSQQIPGRSIQGTAVMTENATESYEQPIEPERM